MEQGTDEALPDDCLNDGHTHAGPRVGAATAAGFERGSQGRTRRGLRGLLLKNLPDPLYEAAPNWGHQSEGRRVTLPGRRIQIDMTHEPRNDGVWRKIRADAVNPAESLVFDIRNVQSPESGKVTFQTFTAMDVLVNFHQQRWLAGVKILEGEARAKRVYGLRSTARQRRVSTAANCCRNSSSTSR